MLVLFPKPAKHILNHRTTPDEAFGGRPRAALSFTFGNHFFNCAFDGFGFGFRAEKLLRALDFGFVEGVVLVLDS